MNYEYLSSNNSEHSKTFQIRLNESTLQYVSV